MERSIDAGALNKRVTLQRRARTFDAFEDPIGDRWETICACWAAVNSTGAREFWEARAAHAELTHKVTIRWRGDVTADLRVLYGGRVFDVIAPPVDYDMRHKYLVLKCREVAGALYTPQTVTLYNVRENPYTFETSVAVTLLPGVTLEAAEGASAKAGGMNPTGAASLYVPYDVRARDALTGAPRRYAGPRAYDMADDKSGLWTLDANHDFFIRGEVVDESGDFQAINAAHDGVFRVTRAELKTSGDRSVWRFEVGGA